MLRCVMALGLKLDGRADEALAALDDILDDIDAADRVTQFDQIMAWAMWLETIPEATNLPRQRVGKTDFGWVLAWTLHRGTVQPEQFDTIVAAFTDDTRSAVAATVAMAAPVLGVEMPTERDPRRYVDEELLAPIDRFVADLAKESAAESDS